MATRQTKRQIQLGGSEIAMIAVAFVLTVTSVFFLGVYVGKTNASFHAPAEDRIARIPVDDFTKYKRPAPIPAAPKPAKPAASESPAAPAEPAVVSKPVNGAEEIAKLAGNGAPAVAPSVAPAAPPVDAAKPAAAPVAEPAAKDKEAAAKEAAAKEAAAKEAAKEKEKEKEKEPELSTGRGYTVQILSTKKQADADALVRKLKSSGYAAYIKKVSEGEGAWYRVRVGSYGAFSEARAMADRCRRDLGLGQAFVSTE